jgi:tol-pal system protein YbgF
MMDTCRIKKIIRLSPFIILCPLLTLSSCVYEKEMVYLNDQTKNLQRRVTDLEASQKRIDETLGSDFLESIRESQAELKVEIGQLKEDMAALSGRLEDSEHILQRTVERDLGEQDALKTQVDDLSRMVEDLDRIMRGQQRYLGLEPQAKPDDRREQPPVSEVKEPPKEPVAAVQEKKPEDVLSYEKALAAYKGGDFEGAIEEFKMLLKEFPKSDRADNAIFWIGESFMALEEFEQAILAYQDVIKKYPKGNKVPNAMIRQADAFLELKDKTSSRLLLKKVVQKYPKSNEAKIALKKLEALK